MGGCKVGSTVHFINGDVNPLTPESDQYVYSSYNFNTLLSRQVIRFKKIIVQVILF